MGRPPTKHFGVPPYTPKGRGCQSALTASPGLEAVISMVCMTAGRKTHQLVKPMDCPAGGILQVGTLARLWTRAASKWRRLHL